MERRGRCLYGPQARSRVPLHCSASGKRAVAAAAQAARRAECTNQLRLERFTPNTITDVELLEARTGRSAHKQMGVDNEEFVAGISCVAVPVHDTAGHVVAALAVHAPTARSPLSRSLQFVPRLQDAAQELPVQLLRGCRASTAPRWPVVRRRLAPARAVAGAGAAAIPA